MYIISILDKKRKKYTNKVGVTLKKVDKGIAKGLAMITQVSITMLTPICICAVIGYFIDQSIGTDWGFIIMVILGIMAGFRNLYYLTKQFYAKDLEKEQKEQEYFEGLKREREKNQKKDDFEK